ncbi:MAG: hypothetical protein ACYSU4_02325, partial [Planctomycetota bacterium]
VMFTHERAWFDMVRNLVKSKGWSIYSIKHNDVDGTHLDEPPKLLKEEINNKIAAGEYAGLGNDARKYLENQLKQISKHLEVKVAYRSNDINEDRMSHELLTELKAKLKRCKCGELKSNPIIDRLLASTYIGNKDSHDYFEGLSSGDVKAFWQDIQDFTHLFYCDKCKSYISLKYLDNVDKKVRCRKGHLTYSWKQ